MRKLGLALSVVATWSWGCSVDGPEGGLDDTSGETVDVDEPLGEAQEALYCSGKGYELRLKHSGKCLSSSALGSNQVVDQETCDCSSIRKSWMPVTLGPSTIALQQKQAPTQCLDRPWNLSATHTIAQTFPCHLGAAQRWDIRVQIVGGLRYWQLEAPGTGQCLDVWGYGFANGDDLQMFPCKPAGDPTIDNQLFEAPW